MENEKKKKKYWYVPLIIGLVLGLIGVILLSKAHNTYVPPMGDDGWFEASSSQGTNEMIGIFLCIVGFVFIGLFGTLSVIFPKWFATNTSTKNENIKEIVDAVANQINNANKVNHQNSNKLKKCKYCGSLVKIDTTECDSCGGKEFEKHKH